MALSQHCRECNGQTPFAAVAMVSPQIPSFPCVSNKHPLHLSVAATPIRPRCPPVLWKLVSWLKRVDVNLKALQRDSISIQFISAIPQDRRGQPGVWLDLRKNALGKQELLQKAHEGKIQSWQSEWMGLRFLKRSLLKMRRCLGWGPDR